MSIGNIVSEMTYIYVLIDPRTGEVRYVGKANNPQTRFNVHTSPKNYSKGKTYTQCWIRKLAKTGLKPLLHILEMVNVFMWQEKEKEWITYYKSLGNKLTNIAPGGVGPMKGIPWSAEHRRKMKDRFKGRKLDDAWKKRISDAHKGKKSGPLSNEHKVAISQGNLGRVVTIETRQKISTANKGRRPAKVTFDAAKRANIGNTYRTGKAHTKESKKKMSESHKKHPTTYWMGKKHSDETKRKISESLKATKKRRV